MRGVPADWRNGNGLFLLAVVAFVALGLSFLPAYQYRINTDATAYVSIARQYWNGGFAGAVNGYWGPLFSALLAPVLALGLAPLVAARLVELAAGLATLFAVRWLALRWGANRPSAGLLALCLVAPLVSYALVVVTPDILLLLLLVLYAGFSLPDDYRERPGAGAAAGACAGLAYLAKSYALPFFVAHFFLINLLHVYRARHESDAPLRVRRVWRNYAAGMVLFVVIAGPWVALLSHKYGAPTIGTAGQRACAMVGPKYIGTDPVFETLIPPPTPTSISYWDDPTVVKMESWRPWQSRALLLHQIRLVVNNAKAMALQVTALIPFSIAVLLFCVGIFRPLPPFAVPLLITVAVFAGGYMPIFVELRYLWFPIVLLTTAAVLLLQILIPAHTGWSRLQVFLAAWLVVTCATPPLTEIWRKRNHGGGHARLARQLAGPCHIQGNLASNARWDATLFAAFHMGARYFGQTTEAMTASEESLLAALRQFGVDYYFVWDDDESRLATSPFPDARLPEVTSGRIEGLRVYAIRSP